MNRPEITENIIVDRSLNTLIGWATAHETETKQVLEHKQQLNLLFRYSIDGKKF